MSQIEELIHREPFQKQVEINLFGRGRPDTGNESVQIPPGKRFVIEYIAAVPDRSLPEGFPLLSVSTTVAGEAVTYPLVLKAGYPGENRIEQLVRLYSDGTVTFRADVGKQPFEEPLQKIVFSISGYLENLR